MNKVLLGDVAEEVRDNYKETDGNPAVVGLEHLIPGEIRLKEWSEDTNTTFTKAFHKGQVLFGRRRAYLKKAAVAPVDGICSGDITVISAKPDKILPELLPFVIQNDDFFDFAVGKSAGSLSPRVKWSRLKEYEFNLPSLPQQKELAKLLWSFVDAKEAYEDLIRQTDELVKSQFIEMFSVEKGWPLVKLSTLCDSIVRGPFGSALKVSFFVEKGPGAVKVYEQKNAIQRSAKIGESYVTQDKYQELKRFSCGPGDFIMSCSGTIGCLYQIPEDAEPGIINQALCKFHLNGKMLPEVFLTYMRNSVDQLETKGSGIKNIGAVSYIKNMEIALPPIEVQQQFAEFIEQSDKSKFELNEAIKDLDAMYKRIIKDNLG